MEKIKTDSDGVKAAVALLSRELDLISRMHIESVCLAVINRYNASADSAELVSVAYDMLDQVINGGFVIRISKLKILCESLLKEKSPAYMKNNLKELKAGAN